MKGKKSKLSCKKVEPKVIIEQLSQCLDEEKPIDEEIMDLYDPNDNKLVKTFDNIGDEDIGDVSGQLTEYDEDNQNSQAVSVDDNQDEEMVQCVPELSTPPSVKTSRPNGRPKFKVTPKRKEGKKFLQKKAKKMEHLNQTENESETRQNTKPKNKEGSWVQCSKVDCLKWRKLPDSVEPISIPERWVCPMNLDPSRMDCTASQETCDSERDYDVVYTQFVIGSIVWAKIPGYPWWPGMVEDDPDYNCCYEIDDTEVNPISYHVSFVFDKDVSRSWVSYMNIKSFAGTEDPNETYSKVKKNSRTLSKSRMLSNAKTVARNAMNLSLKERMRKFSFLVLYKGPIGKKYKQDKEIESSSDNESSPESDGSIIFESKMEAKITKKKTSKKPNRSKKDGVKDKKVIKKKYKKETSVVHGKTTENDGERPVQDLSNDTIQKEEAMFENILKKKAGKQKRKRSGEKFNVEESCQKLDGDQISKKKSKMQTTSEKSVKKSDVEESSQKSEDNDGDSDVVQQIPKKKSKIQKTKKTSEAEETNSCPIHVGQISQKSEGNDDDSDMEDQISKKKSKSKRAKKISALSEDENSHGVDQESSHRSENNVDNDVVQQTSKKKPKVQKTRKTSATNKKEKKDSDESSSQKLEHNDDDSDVQQISEKIQKTKESLETNEGDNEIKTKKRKNSVKSKQKATNPVDNPVHEKSEIESQKSNEKLSGKEMKTKSNKKATSRNTDNGKNGKQIKKSSFVMPSQVTKKSKPSAKDEDNEEKVVQEEAKKNTGSYQKKNAKTGVSSSSKKSKAMFKAPVKRKSDAENAKPTCTTQTKKSGHKSARKKQVTNQPHNPPNDLECYVSIETLEKDINNLYQELSEGDHTGLTSTPDQGDCITVEFLDDELTIDLAHHKQENSQKRSLTDSPEY